MVQIGSLIQWTSCGVDQFPEPKKVRLISDCGDWCFVEGSNTGISITQITIIDELQCLVDGL